MDLRLSMSPTEIMNHNPLGIFVSTLQVVKLPSKKSDLTNAQNNYCQHRF